MTTLSPFQQRMAQRDLREAKAAEEAAPAVPPKIDESDPKVSMRRQLLRDHPDQYAQMVSRGKVSQEEIDADEKWKSVHWTPQLQERRRAKLAKFAAAKNPVHTAASLLAEAMADSTPVSDSNVVSAARPTK